MTVEPNRAAPKVVCSQKNRRLRARNQTQQSPKRGQREQDREEEGAEQLPAPPVEVEPLVAEVGVPDHEGLPPGHEERVVEPERQPGEEGALDEDLDELEGGPAEGEADAPPGGAAQPVPASADHRHGEEHQEQERDRQRRRPLDRRADIQHVAHHRQDDDGDEEDHEGLGEAEEELLRGAVIGEAVPFEGALAEEIAPDARLAPEVVDAQREHGEEHVDDVDPEERPARAVEGQAAPGRRQGRWDRVGNTQAGRRQGWSKRGRRRSDRRGRFPEERSGRSRV